MGIISNAYLLIFCPLLFALLCQIINFKNSPFYIASTAFLVIFFLIFNLVPDILWIEKIKNDYSFSLISIGLEFSIDIISIIFLVIILALEFLVIIFYQNDIKNSLNPKNQSLFFAVFLINVFAIIGIITSNNIFNLYFFIEIQAFCFFSIASISRNKKLLTISFKSFCLSSVSSILILICFFTIYTTFGELNFDKIVDNIFLMPPEKDWFVLMLLIILSLALLIKFFPLWQYFEKIKSTSLVASFLVVDAFFTRVLLGTFLIIKFIYFFFGNSILFTRLNFAPTLIISGFLLIIFCTIKLITARHLKLISIYLAISNLGFIISAIGMQSINSMRSLFFFLLNFSTVNFFIFLFASYLKKNLHTSAVEKVRSIIISNSAVTLPIKLIVIFVAGLPFSFIFFAYWHLALASFSYDISLIMIIAIACANYAQIMIAMKIIDGLITTDHDENLRVKNKFLPSNKAQIISLWILILLIYWAGFMSQSLNNLSLKFAEFLLANTI